MVERRERMEVIAWFCCRCEQPEARTDQKTTRNNAFEQRTGLIRVGGNFTSQPNSHLWLRSASFSRAAEVNRQASGEEPGKNCYLLATPVHARTLSSSAESAKG